MCHLLEKLVGNQYLEVFRILVPTEVLVPLAISENLRVTACAQLIIFQGPIPKKGFHIYDPVEGSNFEQKPAENQYIWVAT